MGSRPSETVASPLFRAAQELQKLSQTDWARQRYEARVKALRDYRSGLREACEDGREQGQIQFCQELLGQPVTTIPEFDRLSRDEIAAMLPQLKETLRNRGNVP